jgi:hypothetical protein
MKIYLAHNFEARLWLRETIVPLLTAAGHEITSQWVLSDEHIKLPDAECAKVDIHDIYKADCLILFADQFSHRHGLGKFVEFGYAYGLLADYTLAYVIVINNSKSSIFFELDNVHKVSTIEQALELLK